jgi:hypothetical protein
MNAPGHPSEEQLKSRDGLLEVMFLLPSCTHFYNQRIRMLFSLWSHIKKKNFYAV